MRLTITRLGHLGDGIADGPIFVPLTLPGEVVEGAVVQGKMPAPKIITPSPDRVRAPCAHFKTCGGCLMQHASDRLVAEWKSEFVRNALTAQGLATDFRPIVTSPARSRRRATLAGRRTKNGAIVGFHGRASDTLVGLNDCHILRPALMAQLATLAEITRMLASRKGEVSFALTESREGVDVNISGGKPPDPQTGMQLTQLASAAGLARISYDGEVLAELRPPVQRFGVADVTPPPGAFLQATAEGEAALVAAVQDITGGAAAVADLFAGCGTFTLPLAARAEVFAAENDASMLEALGHGWRHAQGLKKVTTAARDLFRNPLSARELGKFDAIVIDPPRAGAEAQTIEIAASTVGVLAYVSCNPATFARDARLLVAAGFTLDWVQVVDQFRWSAHIELVAQFSR